MSTTDSRTYDREVGHRLRELRRRYRVKQEQLAARLGVDVATISRYERGERAMTVGTLVMIANQFDVPAATLLPDAHQAAPNASLPAPLVPPDLPPLEAGALKSIVAVLVARPELLVPVMNAMEQFGEGAPEGVVSLGSSDE
jgi:transcriptional regulator with XRE-family HTH domain